MRSIDLDGITRYDFQKLVRIEAECRFFSVKPAMSCDYRELVQYKDREHMEIGAPTHLFDIVDS